MTASRWRALAGQDHQREKGENRLKRPDGLHDSTLRNGVGAPALTKCRVLSPCPLSVQPDVTD